MTNTEAIETLRANYPDACYGQLREAVDAAIEALKTQDAVDGKQLVRCKDCKWWKTNYMWNGSERKVCVIEAYEPVRNESDYCSRGERKENAAD